MDKQGFLAALRQGLAGSPQEDIDRWADFYAEIIDDRMEDGLTEQEAVEAVGPVEDAVAQILSEVSLPKLVKARVKPSRALRTWEIVLIVLGSPIWLSLLIAAWAVLLAVYIVIWAVAVSLYAADIAIGATGVGVLAVSAIPFIFGRVPEGLLFAGAGLFCAGLGVLLFLGSNETAKGALWLSKKILQGIKACFIRKGEKR